MLDPEFHHPVGLCVNPARRLGEQMQQFEHAVRAALASGSLLRFRLTKDADDDGRTGPGSAEYLIASRFYPHSPRAIGANPERNVSSDTPFLRPESGCR